MPNFQPSQPARFISGLTQAMDFQPLGSLPAEDPFFVALYADDFLPYTAQNYQLTGTGDAAAAVAGPGGLVQLTAAATINDSTVMQLGSTSVGQFAIQATNRLWYGARIELSSVAGPGFVAGLVEAGATFAAITDGLYFSMAEGGADIKFNSAVGSVVTSVDLSALFTPVANTFFDVAFVYQPFSVTGANVEVFIGSNLWGNKSGAQNTALLGPMARLQPASYTAVNLTPTLMVATGTATAYTLTADFQMAALER